MHPLHNFSKWILGVITQKYRYLEGQEQTVQLTLTPHRLITMTELPVINGLLKVSF